MIAKNEICDCGFRLLPLTSILLMISLSDLYGKQVKQEKRGRQRPVVCTNLSVATILLFSLPLLLSLPSSSLCTLPFLLPSFSTSVPLSLSHLPLLTIRESFNNKGEGVENNTDRIQGERKRKVWWFNVSSLPFTSFNSVVVVIFPFLNQIPLHFHELFSPFIPYPWYSERETLI